MRRAAQERVQPILLGLPEQNSTMGIHQFRRIHMHKVQWRPPTNGCAHLESEICESRQVASRKDRVVLARVQRFDQFLLGEEPAQRLS